MPASTTPQAEQLLWWRIRPGSVVLEGQFQVRPGGVPITEVVIEADPRLRLLPGGANGPATRVQVEEGAANRVRVQFDEPKTLGAPFRLSWLWPDASGGGQYVFPHVRLKTGELVRNWTAISAGAGLEPDDATEVGSLFAAEFIAAWGEAGPDGEKFLVATAGEQVRPFVIRPVHSLPGSAQSIDWSISRAVAQATYTARLTGVSHLRFEHTISVPAGAESERRDAHAIRTPSGHPLGAGRRQIGCLADGAAGRRANADVHRGFGAAQRASAAPLAGDFAGGNGAAELPAENLSTG